MKCYKFTDRNDKTYGGCRWGEGITHEADGNGDLCSEHWIHAYTDPLLAVVMNPIHGGYGKDKHLWKCKAEIGRDGDGLKFGTTKLTTIKRVPIPRISKAAKIHFGIYCALEVYHEKSFVRWAEDWLSGKDRSYAAAHAAADAADAAYVAAYAAADAAHAAAYAAHVADIDLITLLKRAIKDEKRGTR